MWEIHLPAYQAFMGGQIHPKETESFPWMIKNEWSLTYPDSMLGSSLYFNSLSLKGSSSEFKQLPSKRHGFNYVIMHLCLYEIYIYMEILLTLVKSSTISLSSSIEILNIWKGKIELWEVLLADDPIGV